MKIKGKSFDTLWKAYRRLKSTNPAKAGHIKNHLRKLHGGKRGVNER